jgi:hypothetical protein
MIEALKTELEARVVTAQKNYKEWNSGLTEAYHRWHTYQAVLDLIEQLQTEALAAEAQRVAELES